ncbi:MAG: hypothetical protein DHS20C21_08020 [Gemmatimonadota bacterium]|nr:MAG: hypothetical protein DHS20C21_08020 [Gemmatimonadota bacterium]
MVAQLEGAGATVTENFEPITPALLENFDIIWTINSWVAWSQPERDALGSWVFSGGGLVFEGNANAAVIGFNTVLSTVGAGIQYSTADGVTGVTTDIVAHPTTAGVDELNLGSDSGATLNMVTGPAAPLVRDSAGNVMIATSEVGSGRVIAMTVKALLNDNLFTSDNLQYGVQLFQWLGGSQWASVSPSSGTVPPSLSQDVAVSFTWSALDPGIYDAFLWFESSPPLADSVAVPLHLELISSPDIDVDAEQIVFALAEGDFPQADSILVRNVGTEPLTVDSILVEDLGPATPYALSATQLFLPPEATGTIVLTFAPPAPGHYPATLRIHSDDPDEPLVSVPIDGQVVVTTSVRTDLGARSIVSLDSPRPNPFAKTTTARFQLPRAAAVAITVHDASGRLIRKLAGDSYAPGSHMVEWDGRDESGVFVSSGVYFFRLSTGPDVRTVKAVRVVD